MPSKTKQRPSGRIRKNHGGGVVPTAEEPEWYKDAVIYEIHVRAFADSNSDGIGDFRGLTDSLDYLQDLGVTTIWLLPFYPSPLRDDGYDIADYTGINPDYGTMREFKRFVEKAHERGLRIITELVINHTSDQHAWFKRARKAPKGSAERDFYVWSDTDERYDGVRIIFEDTETSNWSWDPVAQQYYWHRFFSHQPDLNYENPAVRKAVFEVMDRWFETGVDGLRLDAVPYLCEREGTNCENLPETHDILKDLRTHVNKRWPGRMLLGEANQWPEDAVAYFGDGDECHMNFHFPLMPRLFMSLRMEDRHPIVDILEQTPEIPDGCQWAMFLRNHDELTLEMVTDEERDYMYRSYASDQQMRINVGIRRRLAPLLNSNRRKIELLNGLLFSMPGTPVLYYGDEIGMGDNVYLGDRDAVRTPMQWSGDRNAGFSRANPQRLYLPVITDPGFHYESVNVEAQQSNPSSLLWWMKQLIALRKRNPVLARGTTRFLAPDNGRVLAFLREDGEERILVVANLSRFAQPCELDLSEFRGFTPVELFGHTPFPEIGELPYFLTLDPHSFFWFRLRQPEQGGPAEEAETPVVKTTSTPERWFTSRGLTRWLETHLPAILPHKRWFVSKARSILDVSVTAVMPLEVDEQEALVAVALLQVTYADADPEIYSLPVALAHPDRAGHLFGADPRPVFATIRDRDDEWERTLYDATMDDAFWHALLGLVAGRRTQRGPKGRKLVGNGVKIKGRFAAPRDPELAVKISSAEQSNSSALFEDRSIMKLFRRLEQGQNPDLEVGLHLTREARFPHTPNVQGSIDLQQEGEKPVTLAMLQDFVPNEGDAWRHSLDGIGRFFDSVLSLPADEREPPAPDQRPLLERARDRDGMDPEAELFGDYLRFADLLGQRTAEMHAALATAGEDEPDFEPEKLTKLNLRSLYQSMRNGVRLPLDSLARKVKSLEGPTRELADEVLARRKEVMDRLQRVSQESIAAVRIRCHGDYHLGQVLSTGHDLVIIDFEGEPLRPLGERRLRRSALMDVAGMLRSIQYAAHAGVRELVSRGIVARDEPDFELYERWGAFWKQRVEETFLAAYLRHAGPPLVPENPEHQEALLDAFIVHKAAYEIGYELNSRPDWLEIPLHGMLEILEPGSPKTPKNS